MWAVLFCSGRVPRAALSLNWFSQSHWSCFRYIHLDCSKQLFCAKGPTWRLTTAHFWLQHSTACQSLLWFDTCIRCWCHCTIVTRLRTAATFWKTRSVSLPPTWNHLCVKHWEGTGTRLTTGLQVSMAMPSFVSTSSEKLESDGVYLLDSGLALYIWVGKHVNITVLQGIFGCNSFDEVQCESFPLLDTQLSQTVNRILNYVQEQGQFWRPVEVLKQKHQGEMKLYASMVEDKSAPGYNFSYVEFLCHIHTQIQQKLKWSQCIYSFGSNNDSTEWKTSVTK